jgi:predicted negative regulator of RcsB-dependent stress response
VSDLETLAEEVRKVSEKHSEAVATRVLARFRRSAVVGFVILALGLIGGQYQGFEQQSHDRAARTKAANAQRKAIVESGNIVAVEGCNLNFRAIQGTRGVLEDAKVSLEKNRKKLTDEQYRQAIAFYNDELDNKLKLPDCRAAGHILTTDPAKVGTPELPLYAGAP